MATNLYSENLRNATINQINLQEWFEENGFMKVDFEANKSQTNFSGIQHEIKENDSFYSYFKPDIGGSILVFEVKLSHRKFECICYAPILLFGFFNIKISFKEKASSIMKYRQHGYDYLMELKEFVRSMNSG